MRTINLPGGVYEYDPEKPLGKPGGFGQVFAGKSLDGDDIAVKKLHLKASDAAHRELRIADELKVRSFAHVVPFINAGADVDTGDYFVVMPKAEGSLQNLVEQGRSLSSAETAKILLQIVDGLIEVGELVHRDLKPDNILLHNGVWKIADFGISRFVDESTSANTLKGYLSKYYAAPEQWRFERATHATDVYALGCIGFCLLTGKPPFMQDPSAQHQSVPAPDFVCTDLRLKTLINTCLLKAPESRPSLPRARTVLFDIAGNSQISDPTSPLDALAAAAASVSSKEQEAQARQESAAAALHARERLAQSGFEILGPNIERLWEKINAQAVNALRVTTRGKDGLECRIGEGQLVVELAKTTVLLPGSFPESGWDVAAYSRVEVIQGKPLYRRSASLWYMKPKGAEDFRWHEVSYWSFPGREFEPYAEGPGRNADLAASLTMHSVNMAYGPIAIDGEMESDFHDRWIRLLSEAAIGKLRRPQQMPQNWPFVD